MLPHTKPEAAWLAGAANDAGRRDRPSLEAGPSIELIEQYMAKARRLRAELVAKGSRRLIATLVRPLARLVEAGRHDAPASLERRFAALSDRLLRIRERRRLVAALGPRSDRLLADVGLGPDLLSERAAEIVAEKRRRREENKRWREIERQVRRELMAYSDRELDDLGISRVDIPHIARSHKKTHTDLVRTRVIRAPGRVPPAANANTNPAESAVQDQPA